MDDSTKRQTGMALQGAALPTLLAPEAVNAGHGALVRMQRRATIGNKGGLSQAGKPVNPFNESSRRGPKGGASPAKHAAHRFEEAAKPFAEKLAHPPLPRGSRRHVAAQAAAFGGALTLSAAGSKLRRDGAGKRQSQAEIDAGVAKSDYDFSLSPQYRAGIPPSRSAITSPLAMWASGNILLSAQQSAKGTKVHNPFKRKAQRRVVNQAAGALGMLYSPLGRGQRETM